MADYEYHVFVSYRRSDDDWVRWTRQNLVGPLRSLLRPALGDVRIFVDEQVETGADWPTYLARALARSRLVIPVLSRDYFNSDWCRLELALMYHREHQCGLRTPEKPEGLILPLVIDDGASFPTEIQAIQGKNIHDFANPWIRTDSPRQEEFAACLKQWCGCVEAALTRVPPYKPDWETIAVEQFRYVTVQTPHRFQAVCGRNTLIHRSGTHNSGWGSERLLRYQFRIRSEAQTRVPGLSLHQSGIGASEP